MYRKNFVFIFVILFVTTAIAGANGKNAKRNQVTSSTEDFSPENILTSLEQDLEKLKTNLNSDKISDLVTIPLQLIGELLESGLKSGETVLLDAVNSAAPLLSTFGVSIPVDQITKRVNNIQTCALASLGDFPKIIAKEFISCVTDTANTFISLSQEALNNIRQVFDVLSTILNGKVTEVPTKSLKLINIPTNIAKIVFNVVSLPTQLPTCFVSAAAEGPITALGSLPLNITSCIFS